MSEQWTEVQLSTGQVLRVRPLLGPFLRNKVMSRIPTPAPPVEEIKSAILGGGSLFVRKVDDPDYVRALEECTRLRAEELQKAQWLWCVERLKVPRSWKQDSGILAILKPSDFRADGADGEWLDYLEYVVLSADRDVSAVMKVINSQLMPVEEEVKAAEESFRD